MNIQIGPAFLPSDGSTAAQAAPLAGTNATAAAVTPPPPAAAPAAQPPSIASVKQAAQQVNDFLQASNSSIEFSVDARSDKVVVVVVDSQTQQVIRRIPSDEMLAISRSLDQMTGLLIKQNA